MFDHERVMRLAFVLLGIHVGDLESANPEAGIGQLVVETIGQHLSREIALLAHAFVAMRHQLQLVLTREHGTFGLRLLEVQPQRHEATLPAS